MYFGEALCPLKGKCFLNWLDDIIVHSRSLSGHVELLEKVLATPSFYAVGKLAQVDIVRPASAMCRHGGQQVRRSAVANEDRRGGQALVRHRCRRGEVPLGHVRGFRSIVAPMSDALRDKWFASKNARKVRVPWGEEQDQALSALIDILTSPPSLALVDWGAPSPLHTDASDLGAGARLMQEVRGTENVIVYLSHRWLTVDTRRSATERNVMAVL